MAKSRSRSRASSSSGSGKCSCNLGWMVLSWILVAVGLWALVGGFAAQFGSAAPTALNTTVLGWYFAGVLVISLGKLSKWKACGSCSAHNCK